MKEPLDEDQSASEVCCLSSTTSLYNVFTLIQYIAPCVLCLILNHTCGHVYRLWTAGVHQNWHLVCLSWVNMSNNVNRTSAAFETSSSSSLVAKDLFRTSSDSVFHRVYIFHRNIDIIDSYIVCANAGISTVQIKQSYPVSVPVPLLLPTQLVFSAFNEKILILLIWLHWKYFHKDIIIILIGSSTRQSIYSSSHVLYRHGGLARITGRSCRTLVQQQQYQDGENIKTGEGKKSRQVRGKYRDRWGK